MVVSVLSPPDAPRARYISGGMLAQKWGRLGISDIPPQLFIYYWPDKWVMGQDKSVPCDSMRSMTISLAMGVIFMSKSTDILFKSAEEQTQQDSEVLWQGYKWSFLKSVAASPRLKSASWVLIHEAQPSCSLETNKLDPWSKPQQQQNKLLAILCLQASRWWYLGWDISSCHQCGFSFWFLAGLFNHKQPRRSGSNFWIGKIWAWNSSVELDWVCSIHQWHKI